jgi:hypothetical protein
MATVESMESMEPDGLGRRINDKDLNNEGGIAETERLSEREREQTDGSARNSMTTKGPNASGVHVCELQATQAATEHRLLFTYCDSVQSSMAQVELKFNHGFEVEPVQATDANSQSDSDSFRLLLSSKRDFLRLLGVMKSLKWEILTSSIVARPSYSTHAGDATVTTLYYSRPAPAEEHHANGVLRNDSVSFAEPAAQSGAETDAAASGTSSSPTRKAKPRKSISQRFASIFGGNSKSSSAAPGAAASADAVGETGDAAAGAVSASGSEHAGEDGAVVTRDSLSEKNAANEQGNEPGNEPDNEHGTDEATAGTNSADNEAKTTPVTGDGVESPESLDIVVDKVAEPAAEVEAATSPASDDNSGAAASPSTAEPTNVNASPSRKAPRKSFSQRFGSLLFNSNSNDSTADVSVPAVVAEPEKRDNPILQRFKSKSIDETEEEGKQMLLLMLYRTTSSLSYCV